MTARATCFLCFICVMATAATPPMPKQIIGTWIVAHELPVKAVSCWGKEESRKLIGTEIQYSEKVFRWDKTIIENPAVDTRDVTGEQFRDENSGAGPHGSQISLPSLGITSDPVTEVTIAHPPAHVFLETTEIPGDDIVVKGPDTIIFSVCNVYFEAKRLHNKK